MLINAVNKVDPIIAININQTTVLVTFEKVLVFFLFMNYTRPLLLIVSILQPFLKIGNKNL